jgi:hypothetical protein
LPLGASGGCPTFFNLYLCHPIFASICIAFSFMCLIAPPLS